MKKSVLVITKSLKLKEDVIVQLKKDFELYFSDVDNCLDVINNNTILCVLDYTDDINTIKMLKRNEISELIPIIVISRNIDYKMVRIYLNEGAYDFLEIPFDKKILNLRILEAINVLSYPKSLKDRATFDRLCDIYNEETFLRESRRILDERTNDDHFYLVRFDINKFTMINYFFGLKYAEDILKHIARILSSENMTFDICYGRISTDIFAFLLNGSENDLKEIISNIKKSVKEINKEYDIELTFGVYEIFDYRIEISEMLSYAALAAKTIKGIIGPDYIKYNDKMRNDIALEQSYISSFDSALKKHEFLIYLQPKYDIIMEKIVGAEALVRWGVNGRIISPGEFIPIFERNGLIDKLDRYVWEETVKYIKWRMDNKLPIFGISVNVSRIFLSMNNFIDDIIALVNKYNVPPRYLELEITESIFSDVNLISDTVKKLRKNGFKILMDDFGSGYSGLNVLKEVEFDALKIDLKFFSRNDKKSQNIIKSVLDIAHAIDIPAIAEGVETEEYIELLKNYGCNYAQGFYYSKPLPIDEFNKLCEKDCIGIDNVKYLNIHHIENAINEFVDYSRDFSTSNDDKINILLDKFRQELNVDVVYINIASAEGNRCIFTNCSCSKPEYDLAGKEFPITVEEYASQCMLFDDEGLSEIPGIVINEVAYKSILYYGLTRGNYTDGTVGFLSYSKIRKWTKEERKALKLLGRCLHLIIYRKRNDVIRIANNKKEIALKHAYEEITKAHSENKYTLSLILSALKGITVRLIKYNFSKNIGSYYKPIDGTPYIVEDNKVFDTLCVFFDTAIEKPDVNFRSEIENLIPGISKTYEIHSYECLGKIEPDTHIHSTSIRVQVFEENGERTLLALLIDNTELMKKTRQEALEINKLKDMLASVLTNDFVDLTKLDLDTKEIYKFSCKDNQIFGRIINTSWENLIKTELGFIVEDDVRKNLMDTLALKNVMKMKPYAPVMFKYRSRYEADTPRNFYCECKVIINSDKSRSLTVLTTDITNAALLEERYKNRINALEKLASHDSLTDIHNRFGLEINLDNLKNRFKEEDNQYLLLLDADFFKDINDKYGHLEGDKALQTIAKTLTIICEKYDAFTYRLGGDEFVLLVSIPNSVTTDVIIDEINESLKGKSDIYKISMTCGVAKATYDRIKDLSLEYVNELLDVADADLRRNKKMKHIGR